MKHNPLYAAYLELRNYDKAQARLSRTIDPGPTIQQATKKINEALESSGVEALVAASIPREWAENEEARRYAESH